MVQKVLILIYILIFHSDMKEQQAQQGTEFPQIQFIIPSLEDLNSNFNTPRTISPTRGHKSYVGWLAGWSGPDSRCTTDMGNDDNDATMVIKIYEMDNAKSMRAYISCLCISLSDFVGIVDLYTTLKPSDFVGAWRPFALRSGSLCLDK
jgi:hypothetical protein